MIKVRKKINLQDAAQALQTTPQEIEYLIYDIVGDGGIEGEFEGQDFVIKSDVETFINALDGSFKEWERKTQFQEGKEK